MSIRFRVTVAPSGKKYGAIVNTFRDKATGKVKTQGLKSYGVLSDQKLKDEAFLQAVDADVKAIKDQFLKQTAVMREIHSKLDDDASLSKTSSFAMPQYYYALAIFTNKDFVFFDIFNIYFLYWFINKIFTRFFYFL